MSRTPIMDESNYKILYFILKTPWRWHQDYAYYDEENYDYYDSGEEAIHNVDT